MCVLLSPVVDGTIGSNAAETKRGTVNENIHLSTQKAEHKKKKSVLGMQTDELDASKNGNNRLLA